MEEKSAEIHYERCNKIPLNESPIQREKERKKKLSKVKEENEKRKKKHLTENG